MLHYCLSLLFPFLNVSIQSLIIQHLSVTFSFITDYFHIHVRVSAGEVGCHLDRHANIGKGMIGIEGFRHVMNDPRLNNIPMILETPVNDYAKEIQLLCELEKLSDVQLDSCFFFFFMYRPDFLFLYYANGTKKLAHVLSLFPSLPNPQR